MKDIIKKVGLLLNENVEFALATIVGKTDSVPQDVGAKMIVYIDGRTEGTVGGGKLEATIIEESLKALKMGKSTLVSLSLKPEDIGMYCGGEVSVFIEVFLSTIELLIFGGGHVGQRIAGLAEFLGIPYSVVDDREEFVTRELFSKARQLYCMNFSESFNNLSIDERTFIVIVTRGHAFDALCLERAMRTRAGYIGMIGSKNKVREVFSMMKSKGLEPENDPRVYAPVGLELGDNSPPQIALSIMSEIIKIHSGGTGQHMRDVFKKLSR